MNLHTIRQLAEALDPFTKELGRHSPDLLLTNIEHNLRHSARGNLSPNASNGHVIHKLVDELLLHPEVLVLRVSSKQDRRLLDLLIRVRSVFYDVLQNQDVLEETINRIFQWFNLADDEAVEALSQNPMIPLWNLEDPNYPNEHIRRATQLFFRRHGPPPEQKQEPEKVYTFHKLRRALDARMEAWNRAAPADDEDEDNEDQDAAYNGHAGFDSLEAILRDLRDDKVIWDGSTLHIQSRSGHSSLRQVRGARYDSLHYSTKIKDEGDPNHDQYSAMFKIISELGSDVSVDSVVEDFAHRFDDLSDQTGTQDAIDSFLDLIAESDQPDNRDGYY